MLPPRPPSVFSLGGATLLKSRSTTSPPKSYIELELLSSDRNNLNSKSFTDIMRTLDGYRLHSPIESECTTLNIPRDRLCCENLKDLLCLAGACAGVRFESEVLSRLTSLTGIIQASYKAVSDAFGVLSSEEKKSIYNSNIPLSETGSNIQSFVEKVNEFANVIAELQSIISSKRSTISQGPRMNLERKNIDGLSLSVSSSHPSWLETLEHKYSDFVASKQTASLSVSSEAIGSSSAGLVSSKSQASSSFKMTKGKFACFLSLCVYGAISCTEEQKDAIILLLEASNDVILKIFHYLPLESIVPMILSQPKDYWSQRIFAFISTLSELKAMPSDEDSITNYKLFV